VCVYNTYKAESPTERDAATSVWGLKLLVYEALSY